MNLWGWFNFGRMTQHNLLLTQHVSWFIDYNAVTSLQSDIFLANLFKCLFHWIKQLKCVRLFPSHKIELQCENQTKNQLNTNNQIKWGTSHVGSHAYTEPCILTREHGVCRIARHCVIISNCLIVLSAWSATRLRYFQINLQLFPFYKISWRKQQIERVVKNTFILIFSFYCNLNSNCKRSCKFLNELHSTT